MQSAYIHLYLIMINVITFALYGLDKWRAMTRQWRVREKKLIILALIGGSIGAMIGMTVFHHKTRKWYFRLDVSKQRRIGKKFKRPKSKGRLEI
ncbi:MAG TPA: DUF1294 domain-containing protein [Anaerostipes hadrus]|nr:DUF1294 domain-containing protein [Anaerostipes hadrus]